MLFQGGQHCDRAEQMEDSASVTDFGSPEVAQCCVTQGTDGHTEENSQAPLQPNPKPSTKSFSFKKACVVMGGKMDMQPSQLANGELRKIITWKESCNSRSPSMGDCVD